MGEGALGAVAVVLAACVDVSGISPGNSKGDWDIPEAELVAPVAPLADPVVVGDPDVPDAVLNCVAGEGDDIDGEADVGIEGDVGTPRGTDPVLSLPVVWPFGCNTVCPWAVVMPRNMIAMMKSSCIALSCVECRKAALSPPVC
jgi:hypothetical protein